MMLNKYANWESESQSSAKTSVEVKSIDYRKYAEKW